MPTKYLEGSKYLAREGETMPIVARIGFDHMTGSVVLLFNRKIRIPDIPLSNGSAINVFTDRKDFTYGLEVFSPPSEMKPEDAEALRVISNAIGYVHFSPPLPEAHGEIFTAIEILFDPQCISKGAGKQKSPVSKRQHRKTTHERQKVATH